MKLIGKEGEKCLFPHFQVEEQPSKKPKKRVICLARLRAIRTSEKCKDNTSNDHFRDAKVCNKWRKN